MPDDRPNRPARPRRPHAAAVVLFAGLAAAGCQSASKLTHRMSESVQSLVHGAYHDPDPDAKMAKADALFDEKRYADAQPLYGDVAENSYNPALTIERARYQEAECLRLQHKEFKAVAHYNRMLNDFPTGPYRERGCTRMYEIAYGWLKDDTLADIQADLDGKPKGFWQKEHLPNFTNDSRPPVDQEGEALKYLEAVHTHDLTGPAADKALFWCGYVHFYRGRFEEADHFFSQLVEMHKESPLWKEALKLAVIAKNNSTGGAVYDSQKASEALQLVHHAEAVVPEYAQDKEKAAWLTRQKMAVRMQLAEKDFKMAEYYERTHHPASAYFYYELVTRRYPGTKLSDLAQGRLKVLDGVKQKREADKAAGKPADTMDAVRKEWEKLTGAKPADDPANGDKTATGPTGPAPQRIHGGI